MKLIYSKWNESSLTDEQRLEKLLNLFSYILLQTSGDVNEALDWLSQLDERYKFFDENMSLSDFIDKLKEKGLIDDTDGMFTLTPKGEMKIRQDSFKEIFGNMKKSLKDFTRVTNEREGIERNNTTKNTSLAISRRILIPHRPSAMRLSVKE
jgi:hypothetical protein